MSDESLERTDRLEGRGGTNDEAAEDLIDIAVIMGTRDNIHMIVGKAALVVREHEPDPTACSWTDMFEFDGPPTRSTIKITFAGDYTETVRKR